MGSKPGLLLKSFLLYLFLTYLVVSMCQVCSHTNMYKKFQCQAQQFSEILCKNKGGVGCIGPIFLADQLTLFQPGDPEYAHHFTTGPTPRIFGRRGVSVICKLTLFEKNLQQEYRNVSSFNWKPAELWQRIRLLNNSTCPQAKDRKLSNNGKAFSHIVTN